MSPSDQAQRLRELVESLNVSRSISITSGKGGVGKTNVVVNLAIAMAKLGHKVAIVDADLGLANVDVLLNLNPRYNLYHVIERHKTLEEIIIDGPGGVKIIPGASGITKVANIGARERHHVLSELSRLQYIADYVLIDTSAGINRNVVNFVISTDVALIVTTPEPTAITDAYAMIKVISQRRPEQDIRLLINMADSKKEAEDIYERISMVSRQFLNIDVAYAGYILKDDVVVNSVLHRRPFVLDYPYSPAGKNVFRVAKNLVETFSGTTGGTGWLDRLLGWFKR